MCEKCLTFPLSVRLRGPRPRRELAWALTFLSLPPTALSPAALRRRGPPGTLPLSLPSLNIQNKNHASSTLKFQAPTRKNFSMRGGERQGGERERDRGGGEREGGQTELPGLHHVTYMRSPVSVGKKFRPTPAAVAGEGLPCGHADPEWRELPPLVSVPSGNRSRTGERFGSVFFRAGFGSGGSERERQRERNRSSPSPRVAPHYPLRLSPPAAREGGARAAAPPPPLSGGEISLRKT